jgi:signal transduction histidine kinase
MIADGRRASEVIRRIRSLSRKGEHKKALLNVNEIVDESVTLVQREISSRGVYVERALANDLAPVLADRVQLQQVLINLILNAAQAMDSVALNSRRLTLRSFMGEDGNVNVQVTDTGIGFDEDAEEHLFNAFFTTKDAGVGLGLSICRSIVESHNGRIWAIRNGGRGATFQLSIPAEGAE